MNVLIAGGTGHLGLALAELLIRDGHTPIVFGRSRERAERAQNLLGPRAVALTGDCHDATSVAAVVRAAKQHGLIDAYIHNAGLGDIPERPLEHWQEDAFLQAQLAAERGIVTLLRSAQPRTVLLLYGNLALTPLPGRSAALAARMALLGILRCWEAERPGRRFTLVKMGKRAGSFHSTEELSRAVIEALYQGGSEVLVGDSYGIPT